MLLGIASLRNDSLEILSFLALIDGFGLVQCIVNLILR